MQVIPMDDSFVNNASASTTWTTGFDIRFMKGNLTNLTLDFEPSGNLILDNKNDWQRKYPASPPSTRKDYAMASVYTDDKAVLQGGYIDTTLNNETWVYDLSDNTWEQKTPSGDSIPKLRWHRMASIYGTDKVLIFGGRDDSSTARNETWVYDLSDNSWTDKAPALSPEKRTSHAMSHVFGDDKVVMFGGYNDSTYVNDTWVYDLSDNTWTKKSFSTFPAARVSHAMATFDGTDKILLYGGYASSVTHKDIWLYDLSDNTWTLKLSSFTTTERYNHAMATLKGIDKILIFGGWMGVTYSDATTIYDLSENLLYYSKPLNKPSGRKSHKITTFFGTNKTLFFSGDRSGIFDINDTWTYSTKFCDKGTYTAFKNTGVNSTLKTISWASTPAPGTNISFQFRTADTVQGLSAETFVGPDGTDSTYYSTSGQGIWSGHGTDMWVELKAYLSTTDLNETPKLNKIYLEYNCWPNIALVNPSDNSLINTNTPLFEWIRFDQDSDQQASFQVLIDDDPAFGSPDFDSGSISGTALQWQFPQNTPYIDIPEGDWYWKVRSEDIDGDWGPYSKPLKFTIDSKDPVSAVQSLSEGGFYKSITSITGNASETGSGSGVGRVDIAIQRLSNGNYWTGTSWTTAQYWVTTLGAVDWYYDSGSVDWTSGVQYKVSSRSSDIAGNTEGGDNSLIFTFDSTAPVSQVTNPAGDYTNSLAMITGGAPDTGGSGTAKVELAIIQDGDGTYWDGTAWISDETWLKATGYKAWHYDTSAVSWTSGAGYRIRTRASDNASNAEQPGEGKIFIFDDTPPSNLKITIIDDQEYTNSTTISINLEMEEESTGNNRMAFSTDGVAWSDWEEFKPYSLFTLPTGSGEKKLELKVQDSGGNTAGPVFDKIILDIDPPEETGIAINDNSEYTNELKAQLTISAQDTTSGTADMSFSTDSILWSPWEAYSTEGSVVLPTGDGDKTVYLRVRDSAGNIAYDQDTIILDTTPPAPVTIDINAGDSETNSTFITVDLTAANGGSDIDAMSYIADGGTWSAWEAFSSTLSLEVSEGDSEKLVYIRVRDKAGNIAEPVYDSIILKTATGQDDDIVDDVIDDDITDDTKPDGDSTTTTDDKKSEAGNYLWLVVIVIEIIVVIIMMLLVKRRKEKAEISQITHEPMPAPSPDLAAEDVVAVPGFELPVAGQPPGGYYEAPAQLGTDTEQPAVPQLPPAQPVGEQTIDISAVPSQVQQPYPCQTCSQPLTFVPESNSYYCYTCQQYR
jgi:hypothetical protein